MFEADPTFAVRAARFAGGIVAAAAVLAVSVVLMVRLASAAPPAGPPLAPSRTTVLDGQGSQRALPASPVAPTGAVAAVSPTGAVAPTAPASVTATTRVAATTVPAVTLPGDPGGTWPTWPSTTAITAPAGAFAAPGAPVTTRPPTATSPASRAGPTTRQPATTIRPVAAKPAVTTPATTRPATTTSATRPTGSTSTTVGRRTTRAPKVLVIGDSLTVKGADALTSRLQRAGTGAVSVDAAVGRTTAEGLDALHRAADDYAVLVFALGTNDVAGGVAVNDLTVRLRSAIALAGSRPVVLVNVSLARNETEVERTKAANAVMAGLSSGRVHVLDWASVMAAHPDFRAEDGVHLTSDGADARVRLLTAEIVATLR